MDLLLLILTLATQFFVWVGLCLGDPQRQLGNSLLSSDDEDPFLDARVILAQLREPLTLESADSTMEAVGTSRTVAGMQPRPLATLPEFANPAPVIPPRVEIVSGQHLPIPDICISVVSCPEIFCRVGVLPYDGRL